MKIFAGDRHTCAVDGMSTVLAERGAVAVFINVRTHFPLLGSFRVHPRKAPEVILDAFWPYGELRPELLLWLPSQVMYIN